MEPAILTREDTSSTDKMCTCPSLKFIEGCRQRFDLIEPGTEIPDDCLSVGWMDGDWPQLKGVTEEKLSQEASRLKHVDCKHAAGASLVQQPCDLSPVFKTVNRLQPMSTAKDTYCILKEEVKRQLTKLSA